MRYLCLSIFVVFFIGCNRYLDKKSETNKTVINKDYEFTILESKNIFKYKSPVYLKKDSEVVLTTLFEIDLPKKMVNFEISNMAEFSFYYSSRQCIFISNDNEKKSVVKNDTFYIPSQNELNIFINNYSKGSFKNNLKNNKILRDRRFCFFKRKNSTILLYNIQTNNFNYFLNSIKSLIVPARSGCS